MKCIKLLILCILFTSCGAIQVTSDYEKTANFSNYKTYNYFSNIESGLSELDEKRLITAINNSLSKQGLLISETPDFLIDFKIYSIEKTTTLNVSKIRNRKRVSGSKSGSVSTEKVITDSNIKA